MLLRALLASGEINVRKVDGWETLAAKLIDQPIDLAGRLDTLNTCRFPGWLGIGGSGQPNRSGRSEQILQIDPQGSKRS